MAGGSWGKPRSVAVGRIAPTPRTSKDAVISWPVGIALASGGAPAVRHQVASWLVPVVLPPDRGLHGVKAVCRWYWRATYGVRGSILLAVGNAATTLAFPTESWLPLPPADGSSGSGSIERQGVIRLFDIEDWPADTQVDPALGERRLSVPVVISVHVHQGAADAEYVVNVDDLDLELVTFGPAPPADNRPQ